MQKLWIQNNNNWNSKVSYCKTVIFTTVGSGHGTSRGIKEIADRIPRGYLKKNGISRVKKTK